MVVRRETASDRVAIAEVVEAAFGRPREARIVEAIRASDAYVPELSLVADEEGEVTGHVLLSHVSLEDGRPLLELGPLSVRPDRQGRGIGGSLIDAALAIAEERHEPLVLVLGHPSYYSRFGFRRAAALGISPPEGVRDDAWLAITLSAYRSDLRGRVVFPPAFSKP